MRASVNENAPPQLGRGGGEQPGAKPAAPCPQLLADAGISRAADGSFVIADSLGFRSSVERSTRQADAKNELLAALSDSWSEAHELRLALQPTRAADADAGAGDGVKDSLVRLLLHCQTIQSDVETILLETLPEHQAELDGPARVLWALADGRGGPRSTGPSTPPVALRTRSCRSCCTRGSSRRSTR